MSLWETLHLQRAQPRQRPQPNARYAWRALGSNAPRYLGPALRAGQHPKAYLTYWEMWLMQRVMVHRS